MATKKDEHDGVFLFLIVPAVLATLVFSLYYFSRLKKQYLTGPHARRIFDIGAQGTSLLVSGVLGYLYYMIVVVLWHYAPLTLVLTVPLGLVLLIWMGKAQAYAFLGVIVDYDKGVVFFRPNCHDPCGSPWMMEDTGGACGPARVEVGQFFDGTRPRSLT